MNYLSRPDAERKAVEKADSRKPAKQFALVAIVKNEARYLLEWLAFYDCIGVKHFVIFDNESTDDTRKILDRYAELVDIEIIHWPTSKGASPQISAYNYFLENYRTTFEFAAFFDSDEFLIPLNGVDFVDFLNSIPNSVGGIAFNQRVFGSSGELKYKTDLVLKRFRQCSESQYDENKYYKSMYRLRNIEIITNVHGSALTDGDFWFADFAPLVQDVARPGASLEVRSSDFQLNHYILKSFEEFRSKQRRGCIEEENLEQRESRYADGFFTGRDPRINVSTCNQADGWIAKVVSKLLAFQQASIMEGRHDYVAKHYGHLLHSLSGSETKPSKRPSAVHLGELIFRQSGVDINACPPGFHRLTIGDFSPAPEALVVIPGLREEPWAAAFHAKREPVHDLGIYSGIDLTVVDDGYLFADGVPIIQPDVVVPYVSVFAEHKTPKPQIEENRPVIVAYDRGYTTYGHFIIDILPRLLIAERMLGADFRGTPILLPHRLPAWGREIFDLIFPNVKTVTFDSEQSSLRLRRAILPTHCHNYYMFHPLAQNLFETLLERAQPIAPAQSAEFIFLSRAEISSNRRVMSFAAIEEHAASLGATILRPETISWREQLGYFAGAKLVVGEYGSALHNTVFSRADVRTLSINRLQFLQSFIGALNRQRLTYVLPSSVNIENGIENLTFDNEAIIQALNVLVGQEINV